MSESVKKNEAIERIEIIEIVDKGASQIDINGGMCCHGSYAPVR